MNFSFSEKSINNGEDNTNREMHNKMRTYLTLFLLLLVYPALSQSLVKNNIHNLPAVGRGDMKWFDANLDGLYDVVITGIDDNSQRVADVFRNNGDGTFTGYGSGLVPVSDGSIALGDINHDGLIDVFIHGHDGTNRTARLYLNAGNGIFNLSSNPFIGLAYGTGIMADLDNDGDPDLVYNGRDAAGVAHTLMYINNGDATFTQVQANV